MPASSQPDAAERAAREIRELELSAGVISEVQLAVIIRRHTAERHAKVREALKLASIVVTNATDIPDPWMNGTTDCWRVPLDDIENLREPLRAALEIAEESTHA